jgi:hypothetical protein
MTDAELNEAVARARGAYTGHTEAGDIPARWPDVANDPAAWGALLEECAKRGLNPEIAAVGDKFRAAVGPRRRRIVPLEPKPGRALALAFLKAVGR